MTISLDHLAAPFLHIPAPETLALQLGDFRLDVRSNSAALVAILADYFQCFLPTSATPAETTIVALELPAWTPPVALATKPPEPGKLRIKEEFRDLPGGRVVRKRLTGMAFLFGAGLHLAVGPCLAHHNQVVNFINNRHIERLVHRGALLFHAAGVAQGERGLALAGFSGMGKSTLALHAMTLGLDFVSNDRLMVERVTKGLVMSGVAKMPRVNPGTVLHNPALAPVIPEEERVRFEELDADELWRLEHKYDAFIDQCFGPGRFRLYCPMHGLVLLNWRRDGGPCRPQRVDLTARPDLMASFMKPLGLFFEADLTQPQREFAAQDYLRLLADCPVYELTGGVDFAAAASFCHHLLAQETAAA